MTTRGTLALFLFAAFSGTADAAVLTVGPGGTHATVQAAIDAAVATPEDDELRLRATTFFEQVEITSTSDLGGRLELSGGWDADYGARDTTPGATVLDGSSTGRAFFAPFVDAGELVLRGLAFRHGLAEDPASGGGLYLLVVDARATIEECSFEMNLATTDQGTLGARGGGAAVISGGSAEVRLAAVTFSGNEVLIVDTNGAPLGGGVILSANGTSRILMRHGVASGNVLNGGSQRRGGGFSVYSNDSATIEIEDFLVTDNHGDTVGAGSVQGHGVDISASGTVELRRLEVTENWNGTGDTATQLHLSPLEGTVRLTDSLVARGGGGIDLGTTTGTAYLTHLTVTDHESVGVSVFTGAPGETTVTNSIAWSNAGGDLVLLGGAATGSLNLVGIDPDFVDAGAGDYRLGALSAAIDAGTLTPPGGLGPFDLAHASRIVAALPDQGALERHALFADDFEREDIRAWSVTTP